ncbi:NusG antitermination factor, partial [mine drainage metagenome]
SRIVTMHMEDRIYEVVIPIEDVVEVKSSRKSVVQRKVFPGYLLCRCADDDEAFSVIRNTPAVTGFVGSGSKPTPLSKREVESILQVKRAGELRVRRAKTRLEHEMGETVRVKEGPFADFTGQIAEINEESAQGEGPGEHFRPGDSGGARLRPGGQAVRLAAGEPNVIKE